MTRLEKLRISSRECKDCFAIRISGQAFTKYTCSKCGEVCSHPNTSVPKICYACSVKFNICRRCGGEYV